MGVYRLFDELLNGVLLDWLQDRFVYYNWIELDQEGNGYYTADIRWWRVKQYLFWGFLVLVLFSALIIRLVTLLYTARREKKVIAEAGRLIGDYMKHDREAAEVFPAE